MREVPDWDEWFFSIAEVVARRSKDPITQVGAVLVANDSKRILGVGYNGFAPGAEENVSLWQRPEKYKHVIHAEVNCINNSPRPFPAATLYLPCWPCVSCARFIAGLPEKITNIKVRSEYYKSDEAAQLLAQKGIEVTLHVNHGFLSLPNCT